MAATCKLARAATPRAAQLGGECGRGSLEDERPRVGPAAATSRAKKACRRQRHVTRACLVVVKFESSLPFAALRRHGRGGAARLAGHAVRVVEGAVHIGCACLWHAAP